MSALDLNTKKYEGAGGRRVLVVAPQPFYEDRGTPIAVRYVLEALSELGYEVDVLTLPLGRPIEIPQVRVIRVRNPFGIRHVPVGFSLRKLMFDILLIPALLRQVAREQYVCIHAVEEAAFLAVLVGRRMGVPVIYDMQSSLPEQMAQRWLFRVPPLSPLLRQCERWLLRNAKAVMSSTGLAGAVQQVAPHTQVSEWFFPSALRPVEAGEVARLRQTLAIREQSPTVVYSGTFEEYQGLEGLLAAIPRICEVVPEVVFVLVGGTPAETANVLREARAAGLNGHVRVVARQPREAIPAFYAMADVLVSTRTYGRNLPLKIFDYLAAERPIVATDIPPHREILNEERAILVEPTAEGLARGILSALTDQERASAVAAGARAYSGQHLGWEGFLTALEEVYASVCDA